MAVDAFSARLYEQALAVGARDVTVDTVNLGSLCGGSIKQDACLLAGAEGVAQNLPSVGGYLCVGLAIGSGLHACHGCGAELTIVDTLQAELLSCLCRHDGQQEQKSECDR